MKPGDIFDARLGSAAITSAGTAPTECPPSLHSERKTIHPHAAPSELLDEAILAFDKDRLR